MDGSAPTLSTKISWDDFHRDAALLAALLRAVQPCNTLLAITRGGLVPAAIVACALDIRRIETIGLASYDDNNRRGDLERLKPASDIITNQSAGGQGLMVIDDLVDSGKTFAYLRRHLPKAHYAAVYAKPEGAAAADTYAVAVEQHVWLDFPWDKPETAQADE